jgi:type IV pilus assembly protein PilQ
MKKHASNLIAMTIMIAIALSLPMAKSSSQAADAVIKNLESVIFEKLPGKERISLVVSQQPAIKAEGQTNGSLLIRLEDTIAAENLRRSLGEGQLSNILRVTPSQQKVNGKQWTNLMIDIRELVPYSIKQEGNNILIDFNVAGLAERKPVTPAPTVAAAPVKAAKAPVVVEAKKPVATAVAEETKTKPVIKEESAKYRQTRISIDFQDAEIKSVLRLMAEYGDVNIVAGDDVKGKVTLAMKNVPWEQAVDTILEINSLAKRQEYNVITVTTMAKSRKDAADREKQREVDQKILSEKGLLKQILIEAKIVEANESFARNLGIEWRFAYQDWRAGSQDRAFGAGGGTGSGGSSIWSGTWPSTAVINLPALASSPALGLVYGGLNAVIDAQISALEENGNGRIISAPKIVTMEGMKASIKQGQEVPYITYDDNGRAKVEFKEALLKLEVTPRITEEGKITMDIVASNDYPDWQRVNIRNENPPINKNEVKSQLLVNDSDTIVIGGVSVDQNATSDSGLPWLQKIPILGYLFKTEIKSSSKRQLLIFVTPRIVDGGNVAQSEYKRIN